MIRIGIVADGDRWHVRQLVAAAREFDVEVVTLSFRDFVARVSNGPTSEFLAHRSIDGTVWRLADLDALIIRAMPRGSLEQIITRMNVLGQIENQLGLLLVNPARTIEVAVDKYLCLEKIRACGIAVPETVVTECADAALAAFERMRDVVVKPLFGSRGRNIERVSNFDQARQRFHELAAADQVICFQRFIDHGDSDIRLLVVGDQILGMRRHRPGHWLTNLSQGARAVAHQVLPAEERWARRIAHELNAHFAGIDLIYDSDGSPHVIEVNASPGWQGLQSVVPDQQNPARILIQWIRRQVLQSRSSNRVGRPDNKRAQVSLNDDRLPAAICETQACRDKAVGPD